MGLPLDGWTPERASEAHWYLREQPSAGFRWWEQTALGQGQVRAALNVITLVQVITGNAGGSTLNATFKNSVTAGNAIVVIASINGSGTLTSVTDNNGNVYSQVASVTTGGVGSMGIWFALNANAGSTQVTLSASGSTTQLAAFEYSGIHSLVGVKTATVSAAFSGVISNIPINSTGELIVTASFSNNSVTNLTGTGQVGYQKRAALSAVGGTVNFTAFDNAFVPFSNQSITYNYSNSSVGLIVAASFGVSFGNPPTRQSSQRFDPLPDWWSEWPIYKQVPYAQWYIPPKPPIAQLSQRFDSLPEHSDLWYRQHYLWPVPVQYIPLAPSMFQSSQRFDAFPNWWSEWSSYVQAPFSQWFIPKAPPLPKRYIRWDSLFDYNEQWYRQHYVWPVPVQYIPIPPPPGSAPSQLPQPLWYVVPDDVYDWWQKYNPFPKLRVIPVPSGILTSQEGVYAIQGQISATAQVGIFRVQNNIEGWNVYVGVGAIPDLTQPPAAFSTTLPISTPLTPPVSGTQIFYVLVTKQDTFGLNSQNQDYTTFTIDSHGGLVLPPLAAPTNLLLLAVPGFLFRPLALYPGALTDPYPATQWKIWAGLVPPNPSTDTPFLIVPVNGEVLTVIGGPLSPGLWYITIGLYRATDGASSPTISGQVSIGTGLAEVIAVPSGFQGS